MSAPTQSVQSKRNLAIIKNMKIGLATSIISQPFEVLRTSMILSKTTQSSINIKGLYEMCKMIVKMEGMPGFFRGAHIAAAKNSLSCVVFFTGIENISKKSEQMLPLPIEQYSTFTRSVINFGIACTSKFLTTLTVNPLIIIKTKLEVFGCQKYRGGFHCAKEIWNTQGIKGFQKGLLPTLLRDVPWSGIQYTTYQWMLRLSQNFYENPKQHSSVVLVCASSSSIFAILITYPFDNLRVRWQAGESQNFGLFGTIQNVYQNEGLRGFYKGYLPRIMKKGCSGGILWTLYEKMSQKEQSH